MNRPLTIFLLLLAGLVAGAVLQARTGLLSVAGGAMTLHGQEAMDSAERKVLYWVAPMDPSYRRDRPGKSPMGMDLVPVYADQQAGADAGTVRIDPVVVNNLGVRDAAVARGTLARAVDTVGYIDYDETRISHVHVRKEGWIEKLRVRAAGEMIRDGQPLFDLYSPAMVNAQEEYLQALARGGRGLVQASREKLAALGVSTAQIAALEKTGKASQYIRFYAPQAGVLARLNVREGMYIRPETEVMSLANLDRIWLIAEVFEREADWVDVGQQARAVIPALENRVLQGRVEYIYPDLDPVTRTLRVRLSFANADGKLKPNMYAHIQIQAQPREGVLSIPREALISDGQAQRVILALGGGRFQARPVVAGMESGDRVEIVRGLQAGERVVTSAQFLIDSEASLKASLMRMHGREE